MQFWYIATIYYLVMNLVTFFLSRVDKNKAEGDTSKITDKTLLILSFLGGSLGSEIGIFVWKNNSRKASFKYLIPLAIYLNLFFASYIIYGNNQLETTDYTVDAGINCRIIQLSDVHNLKSNWNKDAIGDYVETLRPNYIVITGDLIDSIHTDMDAAVYTAGKLTKLAPTYFVTGNHELRLSDEEYNTFISRLKDEGVIVLDNEAVVLMDNDGKPFALIGLNDANLNDNTLSEIKATLDPELPTVLLAHEPEYLENYSKAGIDVVLSGHNHGGQFVLGNRHGGPGRGVITPNFDFFSDFAFGQKEYNGTVIIISRGIGNSIIPVRFNNLPEIVAVNLQ